jgi:hypothetical protein
VNFIPYWESFHTHALHELSLLLKNFYLQGYFCAYWLLTLNYILVSFWNAIWLFYQLFIHACSKLSIISWYLFEMLFDYFISYFCIFPSIFQLLVWNVRTRSALSISYLTACRPNEFVPRPDMSFLLSLPNTYYYFLPVLSCSVVCVFSLTDPEILAFSAHLFSFPSISFEFHYSLKLWFFFEYWNL